MDPKEIRTEFNKLTAINDHSNAAVILVKCLQVIGVAGCTSDEADRLSEIRAKHEKFGEISLSDQQERDRITNRNLRVLKFLESVN